MESKQCLTFLLLAAPLLAGVACDVPDADQPPSNVEAVKHALFVGEGNCHQTNFASTDVALYVDDNYRGRCVRVNLWEDSGWGPGNFAELPTGLPNDAVTSVVVGSAVEIVMREHGGLMGQGLLTRSSKPNLGSLSFNDITSSFYLQLKNSTCQVQNGQVCLFQDANFNDGTFVGGSKRGVGGYPSSMHMGIQNDSVSSMLIGSGVVVFACKHANYQDCTMMIPSQYPVPSTLPTGNDEMTSMNVLGSCRNVTGNQCGQMSSSGVCSCAPNCGTNCCYDKTLLCGP